MYNWSQLQHACAEDNCWYVKTQQAPDQKGTGHNITSRIPTVSEKIGDRNSVSKDIQHASNFETDVSSKASMSYIHWRGTIRLYMFSPYFASLFPLMCDMPGTDYRRVGHSFDLPLTNSIAENFLETTLPSLRQNFFSKLNWTKSIQTDLQKNWFGTYSWVC